jgi:hypothetical protein
MPICHAQPEEQSCPYGAHYQCDGMVIHSGLLRGLACPCEIQRRVDRDAQAGASEEELDGLRSDLDVIPLF